MSLIFRSGRESGASSSEHAHFVKLGFLQPFAMYRSKAPCAGSHILRQPSINYIRAHSLSVQEPVGARSSNSAAKHGLTSTCFRRRANKHKGSKNHRKHKVEVISLDSAHEPVVVQCDQLIYSSGINPVESHEPRPRPTPIIIAK